MGFTKALFYPTIDIHDEEWLKNAVLLWDEIHTIVPSSIAHPYTRNSTEYLSDEGILRPMHVSSNHRIIEELTTETLNYLNTNEGFQVLTQGQERSYTIHRDKLPEDVRRLFHIHPEKLPYEIQHQLRKNLTDDGWVNVDSNFATFYMTLLANKICEEKSIALLTDNTWTSNLSDLVRLDNQIAVKANDELGRQQRRSEKFITLAQGMLTNLIIKGIKISKGTSLVDVVNFKKTHRDELGLFKTNIAKLTNDVSGELSFDAVRQQVEDIYHDDFLPAYNNFQKALTGSHIKWTAENFMKISTFSTAATAVPMALLGLSIPYALLAGAGVSLISSYVSYNMDKKEKLRNSPYSYLLAAHNDL
ncbi:hypothetical protein KK062_27595 [Fulvivirgaceae bacterium PWU5]|uniref:Uncharacterized protein n=1 Tax=Dawidia cretensis TaxID=2782350 RepID=A0AAP2E2Z4_9BACT|nr:DUF6236 family protein [Dawidia cretensis]MBT1712036.1 hypothetical protein [Dawidia cretensis]